MDTSRVYCYEWSNSLLVRFWACYNYNTQWYLPWQKPFTYIFFTKYWNSSPSNSEFKWTFYLPQWNGLFIRYYNQMPFRNVSKKFLSNMSMFLSGIRISLWIISPIRRYFICKPCLPRGLFQRKWAKNLLFHFNLQRMVSSWDWSSRIFHQVGLGTFLSGPWRFKWWYVNKGFHPPTKSSTLNVLNFAKILSAIISATPNAIYLRAVMMIAIVMVLITVLSMNIKILESYFINQSILRIFYSKEN